MECHNIKMIVPKNEGVRWIAAIANQESLLLDFDWKFLRFQKKGAGLLFSHCSSLQGWSKKAPLLFTNIWVRCKAK